MPPVPPRSVVAAVLEEMHAAVALEALEAAGVEAEAVPTRPFAQLDYFRPQRLPLVELRVAATDLARARGVLDLLAEEAPAAALAESGDGRPGERAPPAPAPSSVRPRWVLTAALATVVVAAPILTRVRGARDARSQRPQALDATRARARITAPRPLEPVHRELEQAGIR